MWDQVGENMPRYDPDIIMITDDVLFLPAIFSQFSPRVPFHESLETSVMFALL